MSGFVAVIGLAATGIATAEFLAARDYGVEIIDSRLAESFPPELIDRLESTDRIRVRTGAGELPKGIDFVVPSPGVPESAPPLVQARRDGIEIVSEIELAYRYCHAKIAAITGTNGKTTTTAMLGAICRASGRDTRVCGNIAEDNGVRTPMIQAADGAPAHAILVVEVSSFQLAHVREFRPTVAAWLNLSVDHQDRYDSLDAYAADKAKILAAQTEADTAVLNAADPRVVRFSENCGRGKREWFSGDGPPTRNLRIPGKHNLANADAAARMARALGIAEETIERALASFPGVAHRMEVLSEIAGVRWINNSMCTNPAAVYASLDAASHPPAPSLASGERGGVIVIAGGKHKGGDLSEMVAALRKFATKTLLIGEAGPLLAALLGEDATVVGTLENAVALASDLARPGDTVILAPGCASFDQFASFEARGQAFRDLVNALGS